MQSAPMIALIAFNPIWITLGPLLVINTIILSTLFIFQVWIRKKNHVEYESAKRHSSVFLSTSIKSWWIWITEPIAKLFIRLHMGPNVLTMIGFFFSVVAGILFGMGSFGYGGWAMVLGASFDMFDGQVARLTGRSSRSGAFFDSVMDRFGEAACMMGFAYYFSSSYMLLIVIAALIGSMLVSYTRARAEGVGVDCKVGVMQRPERIAYVGAASILDPMMGMLLNNWWSPPPPALVIIALFIIAIMTNITAVYRMVYVMNALDTQDKRGIESIPQIIAKLATPDGREELWDRARYGYDRKKGASSRIILFSLGGVDDEIFRSMLKGGELPNISRHIVENGGTNNLLSSFPSTTGSSLVPLVTGCFPGTCDIPGVRWFDRTVPISRILTMNRFRDYLGWGAYAMDYDLSKSVHTIFEYSKQAVNIFGMLNRGCGFVRDPSFFRLAGTYHRAEEAQDFIAAQEAAFRWFMQAIRRETDFVLYAFPNAAGRNCKDEGSLKEVYRRADEYVGRSVDFLKENGLLDDAVLMLAGEHGLGRQVRKFDLEKFLSDRYKTYSFDAAATTWRDAEVIAPTSGTSMAHIYMRKGDDWNDHTFYEDAERRGLVGALLEREGIDIIAGRSIDGGIVAQSRRGRAHILEDADGRITYMRKGEDPFGYDNAKQLLNPQTELALTSASAYPDAIMQLLQVFRSQRAGDILISACPDTAICRSDDSTFGGYTHGSLSRKHIVAPLLSNIKIEPEYIRSADLFSLALDLLGIEPAHDIDGVLPKIAGAVEHSDSAKVS